MVDAREPHERLLHHILGVGHAPEHPVRHGKAVAPECVQLLIRHHAYISSTGYPLGL